MNIPTAEITSKFFRSNLAQSDLVRAQRLQEGVSITSQKLDELRTTSAVAQQDLAMANLDHQLALCQG